MTTPRSELARDAYATIPIYTPDETEYAIDLSDNSNQWGGPPTAERVMRESRESLARYPDTYSRMLKDALAEYAGVSSDNIVVGCGSDDVLDAAIRAFAEPGDKVAIIDPTFVMIPVFSKLNSLKPVMVPITADYDVDVPAMLATNAKIMYLCSPNNPTGKPLKRESIEAVLQGAPGLVLIDEAYAEFAGANCVDLVSKYDRLLIARTMSKAFGLAGLRIGYAIGASSLIREVERSRGPYKVGRIAERAAVAALKNDLPWMQGIIAEARENREKFRTALQAMGFKPLPSTTNFILLPIKDAVKVAADLRKKGISLRPFPKLACAPGSDLAETDGSAMRITIGKWDDMQKTLDALKEFTA
ncbi:MAG: histidinol-phosphate transaminase [Gemmatimonadaceae bacterium]